MTMFDMNNPNRLSPHVRYERDPMFRALVDLLRKEIELANMTPTELREACMLAAEMYEMTYVRPMLIVSNWINHWGKE